jgi:hypothetical protein
MQFSERTHTTDVLPVADDRYLSMTMESRRQLLGGYLDKSLRAKPDEEENEFWFSAGYLWTPEFSPMNFKEMSEKDYLLALELARHLLIDREDINTPDERLAFETLTSVYKVHLQPQDQYIPFVVQKLLQTIKRDPEFKQAVCCLKVCAKLQADMDERHLDKPIVVVYPTPGKESAQLVLDRVYDTLHSFEGIANGRTPALNQAVDNLIYYAQGDRDWKEKYLAALHKKHGPTYTAHGLLELDGTHFRGNFHLIPSPKRNRTELMFKQGE